MRHYETGIKYITDIFNRDETITSYNMKIRLFGCACFISLLLVCTSCSKERTEYRYLSSEFKELSVYQKGSYWIYKNENTGSFDSSYIVVQPETNWIIVQASDRYVIYNESIEYFVNGSFLGHIHVDVSNDWEQYYNQKGRNNYMLSWFVKDGGFQNAEILQSMVVNGTSYSNVVHSTFNITSDTDFVESWIAKKVGVIKYMKKIGNTDTTWSLLRSHTVQ